MAWRLLAVLQSSFGDPTLAALAVVGIVVLIAAGWLTWRLQWKKGVRRRFAEYRERVTHLSETLDALQERHKLLPFTDSDFQEPMAGQTEALYHNARAALEEYRGRWLTLMDAWEKANSLVEAESWIGAGRFKEAERLIRGAGVEQELDAVRQRCADPLDRLEKAHEQSQEELAAADDRGGKLPGRLQEIERAELPADPYRGELAAIGELVGQARGLCRNDPIGALDHLQEARRRADAWEEWIGKVLALRKQADEALEKLEQASSAMNQRRNEGYLFCELGSDPKPFLEEGWRQRQASLQSLDSGEAERASQSLEQAFKAAADAQGAIEKAVKAKARCDEAFARRSADRRRCDEAARLAQQRRAELDREFAADSWREVSGNLQSAISSWSSAEATADEAASLAAPQAQHYCRAAELISQADKHRMDGLAMAAALERRLNELVDLRRRCREQLDALRRRIDALDESLRRGAADRARANERAREAARFCGDLKSEADRPRPDWPRIEPRLAEAVKIAEEAERLAQEDARLAQQAADSLAKAQRQIDDARNFSRLGCTPDLAQSQRLLDEANRRLQRQEYEEAARDASAAEQESRRALADAERRANEKQAQLDQERRQQEQAALQAQAAAAPQPAQASRPQG
jgi:hypothetical protein